MVLGPLRIFEKTLHGLRNRVQKEHLPIIYLEVICLFSLTRIFSDQTICSSMMTRSSDEFSLTYFRILSVVTSRFLESPVTWNSRVSHLAFL